MNTMHCYITTYNEHRQYMIYVQFRKKITWSFCIFHKNKRLCPTETLTITSMQQMRGSGFAYVKCVARYQTNSMRRHLGVNILMIPSAELILPCTSFLPVLHYTKAITRMQRVVKTVFDVICLFLHVYLRGLYIAVSLGFMPINSTGMPWRLVRVASMVWLR